MAGGLLPDVAVVQSDPASPWSPEGEVDRAVPEVPGLESYEENFKGKPNFTKVISREATVVELDDDEGHGVAQLYRSHVVQRGAEQSLLVTSPFWGVLPRRGFEPYEVAAMPFIHLKRPSTDHCLILCHLDHLACLQRWKQAKWSHVPDLRGGQD